MRIRYDPSRVTKLFFPQTARTCPACGHEQRYKYKSSGRHFYQLDGVYYVDGQIVYCQNGRCPLRHKPIHPPEELALVALGKGYGFDVIARIGQLRFQRPPLSRGEITARLALEHPALVISERNVENLFKLYGALVSGTILHDAGVIKAIKKNRALVLSLDGAKPLKDHESVWFVRDLMSGITLGAQAMRSCTATALAKLLTPIKEFARKHGVPVVGVVSDGERVNRKAVRRVFPRVRHQLCQLHFATNLAKPLLKKDTELRQSIRTSMRGLTKIEKTVREGVGSATGPTHAQASVLADVCEAVRSILLDGGKPPFEPPGLLLVEQLTDLRGMIRDMRREKGGPFFERWTSFWHSAPTCAAPIDGCASSMPKSKTFGRSFSRPVKRPKAQSGCSNRNESTGSVGSCGPDRRRPPLTPPSSRTGATSSTRTGRACSTATPTPGFLARMSRWSGTSRK